MDARWHCTSSQVAAFTQSFTRSAIAACKPLFNDFLFSEPCKFVYIWYINTDLPHLELDLFWCAETEGEIESERERGREREKGKRGAERGRGRERESAWNAAFCWCAEVLFFLCVGLEVATAAVSLEHTGLHGVRCCCYYSLMSASWISFSFYTACRFTYSCLCDFIHSCTHLFILITYAFIVVNCTMFGGGITIPLPAKKGCYGKRERMCLLCFGEGCKYWWKHGCVVRAIACLGPDPQDLRHPHAYRHTLESIILHHLSIFSSLFLCLSGSHSSILFVHCEELLACCAISSSTPSGGGKHQWCERKRERKGKEKRWSGRNAEGNGERIKSFGMFCFRIRQRFPLRN